MIDRDNGDVPASGRTYRRHWVIGCGPRAALAVVVIVAAVVAVLAVVPR